MLCSGAHLQNQTWALSSIKTVLSREESFSQLKVPSVPVLQYSHVARISTVFREGRPIIITIFGPSFFMMKKHINDNLSLGR